MADSRIAGKVRTLPELQAQVDKVERLLILKVLGNDVNTNYGLNRRLTASAAGGDLAWRTLDVYDTTLGTRICPDVTVQASGTTFALTGVLHTAITADLTVVWKLNGVTFITTTIPLATPIDNVVIFTDTTSVNPFPLSLVLNDILSCDITASDNSVDINGVASFTMEWN